MISLHCPSTIMRRSAADGNHMPGGLASPSQSLLRGEEERKMREDGRKAETPSRRGRGEGRGAEAGRGRNNQTSVSGVWRATRVSNMEVGYWQAPPPALHSLIHPHPRPIWCGSWRNGRLERVFQLLNEQQVTLCAAHLDF